MADTKRFLTAADVDTAGLASFRSHHGDFDALLGPDPIVTLLVQDGSGAPTFHEACIYHAPSHSVFVTSNQVTIPPGEPGYANEATAGKRVTVSRVYDRTHTLEVVCCEDATPADHPDGMWNGGVNYGDGGGLLYCAQGNRTSAGGLVHVADPAPPYRSRTLVSGFHGRPFNSVNDVVVDPRDGALWFTDPSYGYHQGIRPAPRLPTGHVYRFDPAGGGHIRAVADGFVRPNGLCFAPDLAVLYVTDTGAVHGDPAVPVDPTGPSHIYAFDVVVRPGPFLANRRLFAFADGGCPDGIKCDTRGNVYAGCGDGIEVWNPAGTLIGRILVHGGVSNFCFGRNGALYLCNETRLWKAQMGDHVRGALLGL